MAYWPMELEDRLRRDYPYLLPALNASAAESLDKAAILVGKLCRDHGADKETAIDILGPAYFIHLWRKHRVIYSIDPDLAGLMKDQAAAIQDDEDLPSELLLNLPYPCIAVETAPFDIVARDEDTGEVVHVTPFTGRCLITTSPPGEFRNGWNALSVLFETPEGQASQYYLPVPHGGTLRQSLSLLRDYFESVRRPDEAELTMDIARKEAFPVLYIAQLILYIQAVNADLQSRPSRPGGKRKKRASAAPKPPKITDVGVRIGQTIRKTAPVPSPSVREAGGGGWTVRPHSRRGHWHHFWTGPKKDPDKRKLVLRWVAPTFVNADGSVTPTVHKVKK